MRSESAASRWYIYSRDTTLHITYNDNESSRLPFMCFSIFISIENLDGGLGLLHAGLSDSLHLSVYCLFDKKIGEHTDGSTLEGRFDW